MPTPEHEGPQGVQSDAKMVPRDPKVTQLDPKIDPWRPQRRKKQRKMQS